MTRSPRGAWLAIAAFLELGGCAGSQGAPATTPTVERPAGESESVAPVPSDVAEAHAPVGAAGTISRAELLPILDAGLGRFLQGVSTEPVVVSGRFVGFRILALYPNDPRFRDVDLHPGDIVTRVNGRSIERPEHAMEVWNGLRVASELVIERKRGEETGELRYAIVD